MTPRALLASALTLAACQSVTQLDALGISSEPSDAAIGSPDAAEDPVPPSMDASIATGSEPAVARCLIADGADCDLVRQCGCAEGQHCQVRTSERRPTCVAWGSNEPWSGCRDSRECPNGQTCDRGSCRPHCASDGDCDGGACLAAGASDGSSLRDVQVCWKRCEIGQENACAKGTTCRSKKTPAGETGSFCVAPFDPCPTVADGQCDDSKGTGMCADGSDKKDCECMPTLTGAKCEPVSQCGCAPGLTCELEKLDDDVTDDNVLTFTASCTQRGVKKLYAECDDASECGPGLTCELNIRMCVNHCSSSADCVGGACRLLPNKDDPNIGLCIPRCSRTSGAPCLEGAVCATLDSNWSRVMREPGDYCWKPPVSECPKNGVCDEPEGTAVCAAGTDTADCCHPPNGGACDHVTGCGCEAMPGTQCRALFGITHCGPLGADPPWSLCTGLGDNCPPGYGCGEGVCRPYCSTNEDCGTNNRCLAYLDLSGNKTPGIGGCFVECEFEREGSCPQGLTCALASPPRAFCIVPYADCPSAYIGDGRCDDQRPGATRTCAMGTDPDCDASDE